MNSQPKLALLSTSVKGLVHWLTELNSGAENEFGSFNALNKLALYYGDTRFNVYTTPNDYGNICNGLPVVEYWITADIMHIPTISEVQNIAVALVGLNTNYDVHEILIY